MVCLMKKIIRDKASGEFLTAKGAWAKSIAHAKSFPDFMAIISAKHKLHLTDPELVLMMGDTPDPVHDVVLSLWLPQIAA